jgi:DNA-binding transcriptional LysR family regulator
MSRSWNGGTDVLVFRGSDGAANRSFSSFHRTTRLLQIGKSASENWQNCICSAASLGPAPGRLLESYFADGTPPRIALQLGSTEAVKEAVKAGLGVSLVLRSAVAEEVRNGSLRAIPIQRPALEKDLYVIWRDTGVSHISAPAFVTHLLGDEWKTPEVS